MSEQYILSRQNTLIINTLEDSLTYIPRRHLQNRKSWTIVDLSSFFFFFEFHPKIANMIFLDSNEFLNYKGILSNIAILLVLPSAPRYRFPNS